MFQETFLPAKGSQDTLLVETRLRTGGCRGHTHSRVIPVAGLRTPSLAIGLHSQTEYAAGSSVQIIMTVRHMDGAFQTIRILGGYDDGSLGLGNSHNPRDDALQIHHQGIESTGGQGELLTEDPGHRGHSVPGQEFLTAAADAVQVKPLCALCTRLGKKLLPRRVQRAQRGLTCTASAAAVRNSWPGTECPL